MDGDCVGRDGQIDGGFGGYAAAEAHDLHEEYDCPKAGLAARRASAALSPLAR